MTISDLALDRYAELIVRIGANVRPGQKVLLQSPVTAASLAARIARKAYEAGAMVVYTDWMDTDEMIRDRLKLAPDDSFTWYPTWRATGLETLAADGAALVQLYAPNPFLSEGIDPDRLATLSKTRAEAIRNFRRSIMNDDMSWCLVSIPTPEWSKLLFPDLAEEAAMEEMWKLVLRLSRADQDDPVEAWKEHILNMNERRDYLNAKRYRKLHYKSSVTDLSIELPETHVWIAVEGVNAQGVPFVPNIPTEEVFTMPVKTGVNGVVRSTKPLIYRGSIIDDFQITFEDGKIVDYTAEKGADVLKRLIETDEGSRYLGEVALVPYDSLISQTNRIFYDTLYDENASCHLAIGGSYPNTLEGGRTMSKEELAALGANDSAVHVDFMIGSADLSIDGELPDGTREPVFRNGNWAF